MSKKQYTLITPTNPLHTLSEAGLRVSRTVVNETELKTWLEEWREKTPEFYLEAIKEEAEPSRWVDYTVRLRRDGVLKVEFPLDRTGLEQWLSNYASMDPEYRADVEVIRNEAA